MRKLTQSEAEAIVATKWWENATDREIAMAQMTTDRGILPFARFHEAITKALGRPVWTHEFGLNWDGLLAELMGDAPAPTLDQIIELIPKEKRVIIATDPPDNPVD